MLKSLRIQNFKAWKDTGMIRMAPITLFFGANSSGKSSIGQFLMMLKQTVESPDRKTVFYPGGRNSAAQLGSFQEMVYGRDPTERIEFEYSWSSLDTLRFKDPISKVTFSGVELAFQAEVGLEENQRAPTTPVVCNLKYGLFEDDVSKSNLSIEMKRTPDAKSKYEVKTEPDNILIRKVGRAQHLGAPVRFYGFPDDVVASYQNADFVQEFNFQHEKLFRSIYYLGPLRNKADRLYPWAGAEPDGVGFSGEHTVPALLAARERRTSLGFKQWSKPLEEIIASKLKEMGLIEEFRVKPISDQRQEYEVKLRTRLSRDWVDLPDVGFGISQVLPVLVQCFYAPRDSIILMEQPELHLHPGAQSALADVMIDVIKSREDGADRNIQLIIETHSEHFLRRLQRRIAEEEISQDEVSAYFAKAAGKQPVLELLDIDSFGNIRNWPEHFFGDEMGDITEQAKWTLKRRLEHESAAPTGDE